MRIGYGTMHYIIIPPPPLAQVMLVRGHLTSLERATLGALVVIDVHGRDTVEEMVADKVGSCVGWGEGRWSLKSLQSWV
jgi:hypothetical protein